MWRLAAGAAIATPIVAPASERIWQSDTARTWRTDIRDLRNGARTGTGGTSARKDSNTNGAERQRL